MGPRSTHCFERTWSDTPVSAKPAKPSTGSRSLRFEARQPAVPAAEPGRATISMTDPIFVDTNVWVYAVDAADPGKRARALEVTAPAPDRDLVISTQVLTCLLYTSDAADEE